MVSIQNVVSFFTYLFQLVNVFIDVTNSNDLVLSLGLYVIYPAILYLLIDKFHGVCGHDTYLRKVESISACNNIFLPFTILLRTSKLINIILFSVDADQKSGSQRNLDIDDDDYNDHNNNNDNAADSGLVRRSPASNSGGGGGIGGLLGKLKCQTWMHLSQELMVVGFVSFLLFVCLPVLAFWVMFIQILLSICSLYSLLKRIWRDSQDSSKSLRVRDDDDDDYDDDDNNGPQGDDNDIEFQEFLSNFKSDD